MKSIRYIIGGFLVPIGFFLSLAAVGSINSAESMGGPMNLSFTPFIQLFLLGMSVPLLYYGTVLARIPSGWIYLLLALISGCCVVGNLCLYPTIDEDYYYLLGYGRGRFSPPDPWQHIMAFTCVALFLYWGLIGTFRQAFSFNPHSTREAFLYRGTLVLLAIGLFFGAGYLYTLFVDSRGSAVLPAWRRNMIATASFLVPICCLLVGLAMRRYGRIALAPSLAGLGMLVLVTITFLSVTFWSYNLIDLTFCRWPPGTSVPFQWCPLSWVPLKSMVFGSNALILFVFWLVFCLWGARIRRYEKARKLK